MIESIKEFLKNEHKIILTDQAIQDVIAILTDGKYLDATEHYSFVDLVRVLRCRQRQYFLDRTKDLLHECLSKEHEIDEIIKNKDIGSDKMMEGRFIIVPMESEREIKQLSIGFSTFLNK